MSQLIKESQGLSYKKKREALEYKDLVNHIDITGPNIVEVEKYGIVGYFYQLTEQYRSNFIKKLSRTSILNVFVPFHPVDKSYQIILPFEISLEDIQSLTEFVQSKGLKFETDLPMIKESKNVSDNIASELQASTFSFRKQVKFYREPDKKHYAYKDAHGRPFHLSMILTVYGTVPWEREKNDRYRNVTVFAGCANEEDELQLLDDVLWSEPIQRNLSKYIPDVETKKILSELTGRH